MDKTLLVYLGTFLTAFISSLILTPIIRRIAVVSGCVAKPTPQRWHKKPTALFGGVAIYFSFLIAAIFCYRNFPNQYLHPFYGLFIGGSMLFTLGLLDDIVHFKPATKLIGQIIAASVAFSFGINFGMLPVGFVNLFLTILWLVGIANAFNLLDNMDGLSAGIAAVSALVLFTYSVMNQISFLSIVSLALAGAALGFLRYNFHPAKIFMGDSGSMFLGFMVAGFAIIGSAGHLSNLVATLTIPVLILCVPIFDTTFVTLHRRLNGKPISQGGKDHTSHQLVVLGLSETKAVLVLYAISIVFGAIALLYSWSSSIFSIILASIALVILVIFGIFLASSKRRFNPPVTGEPTVKSRFSFIYQDKRRITEVIIDLTLILIAHYASYLLRFEGIISPANLFLINQSLPWIIIIKMCLFFYFGLYRGIWRYIGIKDLINIFKAVTLSSLLSVMIVTLLFRFSDYSRVVFILDWLLTAFFIAGVRISMRIFQDYFASLRKEGSRVLIYGAGDTGELLLREIRKSETIKMIPVGFVDDDPSKEGRMIHGFGVLGKGQDLLRIVENYRINEVILAMPSVSNEIKRGIIENLTRHNIAHREVSGILGEILS